jgi:RPA family protein
MERQTAYKVWIGALLKGRINSENERFIFVEAENKKISRVNLIANVIDKYSSDAKPYIAVTLDDSSGQIRVKAFADSINILSEVSIGDTVLVVGMLRSFNNELYILPEIVRVFEPKWALVRKLELIKEYGRFKQEIQADSDDKGKVLNFLRQNAEGIDIDKMIMQLSEMDVVRINTIVSELIDEGLIYEPMPGKLRSI